MNLENAFYDEHAQSLDTEYTLSEQQKRGMVLFFAVTLLSVLLVSFCGAGESFVDCFPKFLLCCNRSCRRRRQASENDDQYSRDRALAETLQRQLNEEERQRDRLSKRKERRMWYEYYIKPWTMIVKKSDLFLVYEEEDAQTKMGEIERRQQPKVGDDPSQDSDIEEVNDAAKPHSLQCYGCNDDDNATLYMKLPRSSRCVDATCTFCLDEYEVGDQVVWSNLECQHVFHKECLMLWLSKGKKRCPICRHWFVPGTKIDDQKQSHGEAWLRALSEMERAEKREREKQATKAEIGTEPLNDLEEGRAETTDSPSIPTRTNPEPQCMESDHDVLICNLPNDDSRHSEHPVSTTQCNDIESNVAAMASGEEGRSIANDAKDANETQKDRQSSFKSEVLLGEE